MKKCLSLVFSILFVAMFLFHISILAESADKENFRNNNTSSTYTDFSISSSGMASVDVRYIGYSGITTGATITITIKKNTFLFFWSTKVDEEYVIVGERYSNTYYYDLSEYGSGTYKCNVTYTVSGSGGADDVIPFEDTASW